MVVGPRSGPTHQFGASTFQIFAFAPPTLGIPVPLAAIEKPLYD